jgi:hypothetical protein
MAGDSMHGSRRKHVFMHTHAASIPVKARVLEESRGATGSSGPRLEPSKAQGYGVITSTIFSTIFSTGTGTSLTTIFSIRRSTSMGTSLMMMRSTSTCVQNLHKYIPNLRHLYHVLAHRHIHKTVFVVGTRCMLGCLSLLQKIRESFLQFTQKNGYLSSFIQSHVKLAKKYRF